MDFFFSFAVSICADCARFQAAFGINLLLNMDIIGKIGFFCSCVFFIFIAFFWLGGNLHTCICIFPFLNILSS